MLPEKYRHFSHPVLMEDFDFNSLRDIDFLRYGGGGIVSDFEQRWSIYNQVSYSMTVNSGTSALFLAYQSLGLKSGDEVLVQNYNFFASVTPLIYLACKIKLVDSDTTGNISFDSLNENISDRTRALVITHLWGMPAEVQRIKQLCIIKNIILIEDCSHAHGATVSGQKTGSFGEVSAWSLGARKLVTGGQGGIVSCSSASLHQQLVLLGHYGEVGINKLPEGCLNDLRETGLGFNLRMHPYAVHLADMQLYELDNQLAQRSASCHQFTAAIAELEEAQILYQHPDSVSPSYYAVPISISQVAHAQYFRAELINELASRHCHYFDIPGSTCPISEYQLFRPYVESSGSLENSYRYHRHIIKFLPWYGPGAEEITQAVAEVFIAAWKKCYSSLTIRSAS